VCLVFHPHSNPFFLHTFPFHTIPFFRFHLTIHHFTHTLFLFLHFTLARKQNLTNIRKENFKPNVTKRNIFPNIPSCRRVSFFFFFFFLSCDRASLTYSFKYNQQDAMLYKILYYCQCSTCFGRFLRPSSGAQELYTQHLVCARLACYYR